jgi:glucosamine-6-phosphate deaminase
MTGSNINSGTRSITLDHITRIDAASSFSIDNVPGLQWVSVR